MKTLSLWQPWATAMALGYKEIETRRCKTAYRGPLLIHAAKKNVPWPEEIVDFFRVKGLGPDMFPTGCLLCKVFLYDVREITSENVELYRHPRFDQEYMFGNYEPGRFAWMTKNRELFRPIFWKGRQGLFDVPWETLCASAPLQENGRCV